MNSKPRVALINPGKSQRFAVQEPLNLGFIAAVLEKDGISVKVFDQLSEENIRKEINSYKPDMVGITGTTPVIHDAYEIADFCRENKIFTVMGGVHPWIFPQEALEHADIVVRGEGEKAMLDIVNGRTKDQVIDAGYIENLDDIPLPSRHLMNMKRYMYCKKYAPYILHLPYVSSSKRIIHILTSRGCPHSKCIFCHNSFKQFPYRANSAEKVVEEIKLLKKDYDVEALYFVEDDFWTDKERVVKVSELLIKEGLNNIVWGTSARVEQILETEPDAFKLAKRAGCRSVTIGFESGSQKILDVLNKGYKLEDSRKAVKRVKEAGLLMHGNIILGAPGETIEDVELSKKFLKETSLVTPEIYVFTPYPGSNIWCRLEQENKVSKKYDWKRFNQEESIINLSNIPTNVLNRLRTQMYISYYLNNPKYAFALIFSMILHPKSVFDKIVKTILPFFKGFIKRRDQ
ncbi:MAG: radical SAM protein [Endomicrobiales bacterium]|nr:radical SAM protein [Endomicrobiales bacterium]